MRRRHGQRHSPGLQSATTPAAAGRHTKSLRDGLAAGDLRPLCGPVGSRRARCASYALTAGGLAAAPLVASRSTLGKGHFMPQGYGPDDLQSAYNLAKVTKSSGFGAVVAIVDAFDDPQAEHDLAVYRAQYGLPPCTSANLCFQKVNQDGRPRPLPPAPTADASGWTRGDLARPRHGLGELPQLPHPAGRVERRLPQQPGHRGERRREPGRRRDLEQLRRPGVLDRHRADRAGRAAPVLRRTRTWRSWSPAATTATRSPAIPTAR